jgi:hypothetical protein
VADDAALLRAAFEADKWKAHTDLFQHRHEYPFAPFHRDLVDDFWASSWQYIDLGFRESGKTTLVEEGIVLAALFGAFRNCLIIGAKEELAAELLTNIKSELDNNDLLKWIWQDSRGAVWTNTKITLKDGRCIQARGVGQTMRGTQHHNWRPDLVIINDFEDDDEILTPEGRRKTLRWLLKVLIPACDRRRRKIRIYDTVRDADSVPMQLIKRQKWPHRIIPVCYLDEAGAEQSSWPGHPVLTPEWISRERQVYLDLGEADIWEREMMCNAEAHADRTFNAAMFKVEPIEHTFQAKWCMIDPARTVRRTSAMTGWAVWSWQRNRLIVWEAGAKHLMPDEIVDLAFRLAREHQPVEVGIEEDGLNEWLLQPIRARAISAGAIPLRAVRAPRGKIDFIRGLQPFFAAGEIVCANHEMPELRDQLLGFPTGRIDAPNALAYALQLRPGRLIYEGFNPNVHIRPGELGRGTVFLAANATRSMVVGVLLQVDGGRINVIADWALDGDPGEAAETLLRNASMSTGGNFTVIAGSRHFDQWTNVGLVQALRALGVQCRPGGSSEGGRAVLRRTLEHSLGGEPEFSVAPEATWTLRAFAGGYARPFRDGRVSDIVEDNRYKVLMEGLENLAGLWQWGIEEQAQRNLAYDQSGKPYLSILPAARQKNRPEERARG